MKDSTSTQWCLSLGVKKQKRTTYFLTRSDVAHNGYHFPCSMTIPKWRAAGFAFPLSPHHGPLRVRSVKLSSNMKEEPTRPSAPIKPMTFVLCLDGTPFATRAARMRVGVWAGAGARPRLGRRVVCELPDVQRGTCAGALHPRRPEGPSSPKSPSTPRPSRSLWLKAGLF